MPYRGKPSTGCGECRKRRSRCDRAIPSCGQCVKTNRTCPGYRNATDLMFHDQSTHTVKKVTGRTSFVVENSQPKSSTPLNVTNYVMCPSLEELGVNFFMSDLVAGDPNLSQLYYIPSFYAKSGYAHPGLHYSITATGLASYARATGRRDMVDHATKCYVSAVRGINSALSNPKTAAQDSTLLCINLAAMFEVLAAQHQDSQDNCMKHMEGAVTVALLHMKQGRQTEITQKILSTMMQGFTVYAWLNNRPLPVAFTELQGYTDSRFYISPMHYSCLNCLKDVVDFRHGLQTGPSKAPLSIIHKGLEIDSALDKFMVNMPQEARFDSSWTCRRGVEHLVYEGYFHSYPNPFITHTWNLARTASIHIRRVILQQCHVLLSSSLAEEYASARVQRAESEAKVIAYTIEIAATVPQLGGYMEHLLANQNSTDLASPPPDDVHIEEGAGELGLGTNISTASMGLAPHMTITSARPAPKPTTTTLPSAPNDEEVHADSSAQTKFVLGPPATDNIYHVLFQLYHLREIKHLPPSLKEWIEGRIDWFESYSSPNALAKQQIISKRFWPI